MDFKEEFLANNEIISGGELLDKLDFDEWINYVEKNSSKDTVSADWVVTDVFFAMENNEILGVISFRHQLNEFLKNWGHIGYSVRPSKRGNAIATHMLKEIVLLAHRTGLSKLQLSCYDNNIASKKTILKNGGLFVRSFNYLGKKVNIYVINLFDEDKISNINYC